VTAPVGATVVRVLPGPHVPAAGAGSDVVARLAATPWRVGAHVDRVGVRLEPAAGPGPEGGGPVASTPMVTGAVQLPPDGRPIVLLPDHATVGGYPVVACVITADLSLLGQLAPGDAVAFVAVDRTTADRASRLRRDARAAAVSGWFPTATGT
jgi:allophanate hydrolase subunit 2